MNKRMFLAAAATLGFLASSAWADDEYIPLEVVVGKADRIVVGKVTAIGKPTELTLESPDFPTPQKGWYHTFTVTVASDLPPLRCDHATKVETIEVLTPCDDPTPKPAPAVLDPKTPVIPPGGPQQRFDNVDRTNHFYVIHTAMVGSSYLMILGKLPGRSEYYLSSYKLNFKPEGDSSVKDVEKLALAGIESWSWGKAVNGLQIGFHLFTYCKIGDNSAQMDACVVLRNTTDKPLAVNLYEMDIYLDIAADGAGGNPIHAGFYNWKKRPITQFDPAVNSVIIPAKGKLFIGPYGRATYVEWDGPLGNGKHTFTVSYTSKRQDKGKDKLTLWTGKITSSEATATFKP